MTQTTSVTVTTEQWQQIYDYLRPIAGTNKNDCSLPADSCVTQNDQIDCCLSANDLVGVNLDPNTAPFKINGVWYGDVANLPTLYAKAVALDRNDGSFDGVLQTTETTTSVTLKLSFAQYDKSIFKITREDTSYGGVGNGWIVEEEPLEGGQYRHWLVTTASVVDDDDAMETSWQIDVGKEKINLTAAGVDHCSNVGVLYFDSGDRLGTVPLGEEVVSKTDSVIVYGFQDGETPSESSGTVNNLEKYSYQATPAVVQFGATTVNENEGSPVFNTSGYCVGMSLRPNEDQVSLFLPINEVRRVYQQIRAEGVATHGYSGLLSYSRFLEKEELISLGVTGRSYGLIIQDTPLANNFFSQLEVGDIVLQYDGKSVPDANNIQRMDAYFATITDRPVILHVLRGGEELDVEAQSVVMHQPLYPTYKTEFTTEEGQKFILKEVDRDYLNLRWDVLYEENHFLIVEMDSGDGVYLSKGILTSVNTGPVNSIEEFRAIVDGKEDVKKFVFAGLTPNVIQPDYFSTFIISCANPRYREKF
ncbi:MAG: HtrA [uncultured bacterium]|nr:MAG: HtrA [uncultured bacterium]HLD44286.1 S1C family serine protease [bacterium]